MSKISLESIISTDEYDIGIPSKSKQIEKTVQPPERMDVTHEKDDVNMVPSNLPQIDETSKLIYMSSLFGKSHYFMNYLMTKYFSSDLHLQNVGLTEKQARLGKILEKATAKLDKVEELFNKLDEIEKVIVNRMN